MPEEHSPATSAPHTGAPPGDEWAFVSLRGGPLNTRSRTGSVASRTCATVETYAAETVSLKDRSASNVELDLLSTQSGNGGGYPSSLPSGKPNPEAGAETPLGPQLAIPDASLFGPPLPGLDPGQDPGPLSEEDTKPEERSEALQPDAADKSKRVAHHACSSSPGLAECSTEELWTELKVRLWASLASLREKFSTVTTTVYHTLRPYLEDFVNFWRWEESFGRTSKPKSAQGATETTESTEKIPHEADGETEPKAMSESPSARADIGGSDQQGTSSQEHGNGPTACDKASLEVTVTSGAGQGG
jgi:hypothetical protein